MSRFLIEVPHDPDTMSCEHAVQVLLSSGSHFVTNAQWGCLDGVHTAWLIVDVGTREEARSIVPLAFRRDARVVGLNEFSLDRIDVITSHHAARV